MNEILFLFSWKATGRVGVTLPSDNSPTAEWNDWRRLLAERGHSPWRPFQTDPRGPGWALITVWCFDRHPFQSESKTAKRIRDRETKMERESDRKREREINKGTSKRCGKHKDSTLDDRDNHAKVEFLAIAGTILTWRDVPKQQGGNICCHIRYIWVQNLGQHRIDPPCTRQTQNPDKLSIMLRLPIERRVNEREKK